MPENTITIIGNLTAEPELRFTQSGAAVANFTIASTPRVMNKATQEWEDGESLFMRCSLWREAAENVSESLSRGTRVIATGKLKQRAYETREGEKRTVIEMEIEEIGPSLRYAKASVSRLTGAGKSAPSGGGGYSNTTNYAPSNSSWGSNDDIPF